MTQNSSMDDRAHEALQDVQERVAAIELHLGLTPTKAQLANVEPKVAPPPKGAP